MYTETKACNRESKRDPERKPQIQSMKHSTIISKQNKKAQYMISIKQADCRRALFLKKKKLSVGGPKQLKPFHILLHRI